MGMDKNIKYVREARVAPLLNDMVMHLLATTPNDPLSALITYLERRQHKDGASHPPDAPVGTAASPMKAAAGSGAAAAMVMATSSASAAAALPAKAADTVHIAAPSAGDDAPPLSLLTRQMDEILMALAKNESNFLAQLTKDAAKDSEELSLVGQYFQNSTDLMSLVKIAEGNATDAHLLAEQVTLRQDATTYICQKGLDIVAQLRRSEGEFGGPLMEAYNKTADDALHMAINQHKELMELLSQAEVMEIRIESCARNGGSLGHGGLCVLQEVTKDVAHVTTKLRNNFTSLGKRDQVSVATSSTSALDIATIEHLSPKKQVELLMAEIQKGEAEMLHVLAKESFDSVDCMEAIGKARMQNDEILHLCVSAQTNNRALTTGLPTELPDIVKELERSSREIRSCMFQLNRATATSAAKPALSVIGAVKKQNEDLQKMLSQMVANGDEAERKQAAELKALFEESLAQAASLEKQLKFAVKHK
eukprot:PhM_4_TR11576/c0_g1_i1/m.29195